MGLSAGAGSPVYFMCHACRNARARSIDWRDYKVGTVTLTGRTKPYKAKRYTGLGVRSRPMSREYRCTCGYVGWSNHADLARMAEAGLRGPLQLKPRKQS